MDIIFRGVFLFLGANKFHSTRPLVPLSSISFPVRRGGQKKDTVPIGAILEI